MSDYVGTWENKKRWNGYVRLIDCYTYQRREPMHAGTVFGEMNGDPNERSTCSSTAGSLEVHVWGSWLCLKSMCDLGKTRT